MTSDIVQFYKDKNVLLTGGTGFFGKMIIEKLLRTCDVNMIYLIVRPKKGLGPRQRLQSLFEEPVFERVRGASARNLAKIHTLEGNLSKTELGLSEEDKEVIRNEIDIVFHCGASLNMDSRLGEAVITNVRGTFAILDLMRNAKNLKAFILVSTAYSNCYEFRIEEKFYEPTISPELLIKLSEELDPNILNDISPGLIGRWPNPYVFTKAVAENLIITKGENLPVALFRPTIVTSTAHEPVSGWSDNLYGPLGILLSSHCGILRVIQADGSIRSHTVPGDMCINALLCLAWDVDKKWNSLGNYFPPVLNFSAKNTKLLIPMKQYVGMKNIDFPPFKRAMWYQMIYLAKCKYHYIILKFLLHTIPAYLIDTLLVLSLKKPRMKKLYSKLEKTSDILRYFLLREWDISNDNVKELWDKMSYQDRQIFNFDIDSLDLNTYFESMIIGLKKFILKEDMTKLKTHEQRYKRLKVLHYTMKYFFVGLTVYSLHRGLGTLLSRRKK